MYQRGHPEISRANRRRQEGGSGKEAFKPEEDRMADQDQKREMTVAEAGRKGGQVVKQKYGAEFYGQIGKKGGSTTKSKYGADHYSTIGRRGGQTTSERHGPAFYEEIGKKGGQRVRELVARGKLTDK
jgi:general stress protein YciG